LTQKRPRRVAEAKGFGRLEVKTMTDGTDPRDYVERCCKQFAAKVWNEAVDRAAEQVHNADNYRDAAVRIYNMKIKDDLQYEDQGRLGIGGEAMFGADDYTDYDQGKRIIWECSECKSRREENPGWNEGGTCHCGGKWERVGISYKA